MDCTSAHELIQDDLDGRLDEHEPGDVVDYGAHLAICADCTAEREELRAVADGLASLERVPAPESLRDAVMERVVARGRPRPLGLDFPGGWPALTAAAALLLVAVILFVPDRSSDPVDDGAKMARGEEHWLDDDRGAGARSEYAPQGEGMKKRGAFSGDLTEGKLRRDEFEQLDEAEEKPGGASAPDPGGSPAPALREVRYRVEDPARTARLLATALRKRRQSFAAVPPPGDLAGDDTKDLEERRADAKGTPGAGGAGSRTRGDAGDGLSGRGRTARGGRREVPPGDAGGGGAKSDDADRLVDPNPDPAARPDPLPAGAIVVELTEAEYAFLQARLVALSRPRDELDPASEPSADAPFEMGEMDDGIGGSKSKEGGDADDEEAPAAEKAEGAERPAKPRAPADSAPSVKAEKKPRKIRVVLVPARPVEDR